MTSVGLFEAKTHLSALARRVAAGEEIIVTDRGKPVMKLVPVQHPDADRSRAVARLDELRARLAREGVSMTVEDILAARDEGRR